MKHYRQIIINIAVEDDTPEDILTELKDKVEHIIDTNIDKHVIEKVEVKLN